MSKLQALLTNGPLQPRGTLIICIFLLNCSSLAEKIAIWKLPDDFIILDGEPDIIISDQATVDNSEFMGITLSVENLAAGQEVIEQNEIAVPEEVQISGQSSIDDEVVELGIIEGFPDWRKVDCDDGVPYYFNAITQETQWDMPGSVEVPSEV